MGCLTVPKRVSTIQAVLGPAVGCRTHDEILKSHIQ